MKSSPFGMKKALTKGITFLIRQNRLGYREAVHCLPLPSLNSTGPKMRVYPVDLFPRMLVLDSLLDCQDIDARITHDLIEREVEVILASKHPLAEGGWNYVPQFPDLPPDADDLALVLQLLIRTRGKSAGAVCDRALQILLDYNLLDDGSFTTWIVDPLVATESNRRMLEYTHYLFGRVPQVPGGGGAHPDVVSNMLYALILYDADRFQTIIRRGASYLESCQAGDGHWDARWYWGEYYTTYRALAVLCSEEARSKSVKRANEFVLGTQSRDGGWGEARGMSDPLNTAFGLLCVLANRRISSEAWHTISRGLAYLNRQQLGDGSWRKVRLVRMEIAGKQTLEYGSRSATTSFCVKAFRSLLSRQNESSGS